MHCVALYCRFSCTDPSSDVCWINCMGVHKYFTLFVEFEEFYITHPVVITYLFQCETVMDRLFK